MPRKLASIRRIAEIAPIADADAIEAVRVDGWWVVARKNEFQVDDLVCYFEIDSWIPTGLAPFLTKPGKEPREYEGERGERLRTVRLRGQLSQGLIIPLSNIMSTSEGDDLTELLGIRKYDPPVPAQLAGQIKGVFPSFIKKTDQERIQNLPEWPEKHRDVLWEVSVKLDGSSMTVYYNNGDSGVCSRNLDLKEDESNTFWKVTKRYRIIEALSSLRCNIAIQGELIGEGIQGNHEKIKGQDFFVFDIWDIDQQRHCTVRERLEFLGKLETRGCKLQEVPVLHDSIPAFRVWQDMTAILHAAGEGGSYNVPLREGLVFKATQPINGEVLSFKAINNAFLLAEK